MTDGPAASSWKVWRDEDRIVAMFEGLLTAEAGIASAQTFGALLKEGPSHVVWDVARMSGYELLARRAWQSGLWPLRRNILSITVLGGNAIVKLGAAGLAFALGVRCRFQ
jgi:hypothetical protein